MNLQVGFLGVLLRLRVVVRGGVLGLGGAAHHEAAASKKAGGVAVARVLDEATHCKKWQLASYWLESG